MITITSSLWIDENDLHFDFIRASGPGGQNVNKVASAVQLRFNVSACATLPEEVRLRLLQIAGRRVSEDGCLLIEASRYRTQEQNREDALARLVVLLQKAAERPRVRKKTRPSAASQARRIEEKKRRGALKRLRRSDTQD